MFRKFLWAALICTTIASAAEAQPNEARYEPASQWRVDNEAQLCRLSRDYQRGDDRLSLSIEQFQPGGGSHLLLIGKPVDLGRLAGEIEVQLGSGGKPYKTRSGSVALPDKSRGTLLPFFQFGAPGSLSPSAWPAPAKLEAIDAMAFNAEKMGKIVLQTKTLGRAMEEMRSCQRRLVASWGFDSAVQESLARRVEPIRPATWIRPSDYPPGPLYARRSSVVVFRLGVDATGKPSACTVSRFYSSPQFADMTCRSVMKRAAFKPALDKDGRPVASYYVSSVTWLSLLSR